MLGFPPMMQEATFLFYVLATLDFAWSAPSFLRESDFTGLFLSLVKKLLVISFFLCCSDQWPGLDSCHCE